MSNTFTKAKFSASTDGKGIVIAATATPGTLIHTAVTGTTAGTYDEIWLWLANVSLSDVIVTIQYGDASTSTNINYTVATNDGLKCVLPGIILQNGATLKAFANTANVVNAFGYVNQIVHA